MDSPSTRCPWGWTTPARGVLTVLAVTGAIGLLVIAPRNGQPAALVPELVVDPNTAPPAVLGALPKLGPSLVARIVEVREQAPFSSLDDFDARVRGVGPSTIEALRPHLRTGMAAAPEESSPAPSGSPTTRHDR